MTEKKDSKAAPKADADVIVLGEQWKDAPLGAKLAEMHRRVSFMKKDQSGYAFKYVSSAQVLMALRGIMDEVGVMLIPSITRATCIEHGTTKKGGKTYLTQLWLDMTWINTSVAEEPPIISKWYSQGIDDMGGEKGPGIAQTYAEKMYLLKTFNIATDELDPDVICNKKPNQKASGGMKAPAPVEDKPKQQPKHIALALADPSIEPLLDAYRERSGKKKKEVSAELLVLWEQDAKKDEKKYLEIVKENYTPVEGDGTVSASEEPAPDSLASGDDDDLPF